MDGISQRTSLQTSVENCKYTQHHPIGVGDLPGHQLRVFEIHCTFPNNPPVINGVVLKEQWFRGLTDLTDNSGPGNFYAVYEFANGDKFFTHLTMVAHKAGRGYPLPQRDISRAAPGNLLVCEARFERCSQTTLRQV